MRIHVFRDLFVRAWPQGTESWAEAACSLPVAPGALAAPAPTDAMLCSYDMPQATGPIPRLKVEAVDRLLALGEPEPVLRWVVLDFDNPKHQAWADDQEVQTYMLGLLDGPLTRLPPQVMDAMALYTTRAGWRAMWRLGEPIPCSLASSFLAQFAAWFMRTTGVELDPSSAEWSRLMRLPRALRDGKVLDPPVVALEPLETATLDGASFGFKLTPEARRAAVQYQDIDEEALPEPSLEDRACAVEPAWVLRGLPVPPTDDGSVYMAVKAAMIQVGRAGVVDPRLLLSLFRASIKASGREVGEFVRLAQWVAAHVAQPKPLSATIPDPVAPTSEQWDSVRRILGEKDPGFNRLREGLALASSPTDARAKLFTLLRRLASAGWGEAQDLFNVAYDSARAAADPAPPLLWQRVQELEVEYEGVIKARRQNRNMAEAYRLIRPLLLCPPVGRDILYIYDPAMDVYQRGNATTLPTLARDLWSPLPFEPQLRDPGSRALRPVHDLLQDYGEVIRITQYQHGFEGCRFERESSTLTVGTHNVDSRIVPGHSPIVEEWLERLDTSGDLLRWLSVLTMLDEPVAALYLDGPSGCGKDLLASTLAKVFGAASPVDYNQVANGRFNGDLLRCPVMYANEGIKPTGDRATAGSELFRIFTGARTHAIEPKFGEVVTLTSCLRVYIGANGQEGLPFREAMTRDGLDAVTARILYLKAPPDPDDRRKAWVSRHARDIAAQAPGHLLWLRDTLMSSTLANRDDRFVVAGHTTEFHQHWFAAQGLKTPLLEVISWLLDNSQRLGKVKCRIKDDLIEVEAKYLPEMWDKVAPGGVTGKPSTDRIHKTLAQLAIGPAKQVRWPDNTRPMVYQIPVAAMYDARIWTRQVPEDPDA